MQILRASEDYLETMLMMKEKHGYIRSIDIAEYLGVDPETAEADACKMEHDISQQTFEAICRHAGRAE